MARDLKLIVKDLAQGLFNLAIENGDLVIVENLEEIVQSLYIRLNLLIGTWFLDGRIGIDLFGKVLGKIGADVTLQTAEKEIRRVILETEGVKSITSFKIEII
jgi:hypothetical protein